MDYIYSKLYDRSLIIKILFYFFLLKENNHSINIPTYTQFHILSRSGELVKSYKSNKFPSSNGYCICLVFIQSLTPKIITQMPLIAFASNLPNAIRGSHRGMIPIMINHLITLNFLSFYQ
ncbi:unnamed protein product, partial [Vitis vinifera]|uniref:Uncharacterized protein n=1 Tax=Vitis vinifera TaxID=29760 RepID=D7TNB5_VITVI